ncbi:MAG: methyltransferase type 11, partial [Flavobacteriales bacterium]|nr:methyltransferase type 11 [Flavobacteriales bacterium]
MCSTSADNAKILGRRLNQSQGRKPQNKIGITVSVMKCKKCGLIYPNPMPIPEDIQDHYGVPPEEYWTEEFLTFDENYYQGHLDILETILPFKEGMKALDIGAGIGKCMYAMEKRGFDSYGIEPSNPFYKRAITKMGMDPEKLKNVQIEDADFPENNFDFITFGAVLEHLYDPNLSIKKALSWLKPGGIIAIEVPNSNWFFAKLFNLVYKVSRKDYVTNLSPMHEPFHLYEFTPESFKENAELNGYEVARIENWVGEVYGPKYLKKYIK